MTTPARADLTNLFAPPSAPEPFRQGEILTFNAATGANTVNLGGAVLTNLPILVGGDTVNFEAGDAVILLRYRSSWAILGRIVGAGSGNLTAAAVDFSAGGDAVLTPWTITSSFTTEGSATIATPAWANSMLIMAHSTVIASNTGGGSELIRVITEINGGGGGETLQDIVTGGGYHTTFAPVARVLGAGGPGYPLTASTVINVRVRTNGLNLNGIATFLNYIAVFRKV